MVHLKMAPQGARKFRLLESHPCLGSMVKLWSRLMEFWSRWFSQLTSIGVIFFSFSEKKTTKPKKPTNTMKITYPTTTTKKHHDFFQTYPGGILGRKKVLRPQNVNPEVFSTHGRSDAGSMGWFLDERSQGFFCEISKCFKLVGGWSNSLEIHIQIFWNHHLV